MQLASRRGQGLCGAPEWGAGEPLWKVVPKRDEHGRPYTDFMMLAPGLNKRSQAEIESVLTLACGVLERFGEEIAFADFNLSMNVLWVSLRHRPGLMSEVVALLRARVPMFRLVAHNPAAGC